MERGAGGQASREGGRLWMRLLGLAGVLLLDCDTCELCSDRLSHFRSDAGDTLDPVGRSRELVKRGDVVPLQSSPGLQGQTQTWDGTFTNLPGVTGHLPRLLPSGCRVGSMWSGWTVLPRRRTRGALAVACFTRNTSSLTASLPSTRRLSEVTQPKRA
jgi:hypothetical protein